MDAVPLSPATLARLRRAGLGFLAGAAAFALFSIAAPLAQKALAPTLCALPPGRHFPSGYCVFFTALAGALWVGPAAVLALFPALRFAIPSMLAMRALSDLTVALFAALLFAQLGLRKGASLFVLSSILLVAILTLFFAMFAVTF